MEAASRERTHLLKNIFDKYINQIVEDSKTKVDYRETCSTLLVLTEGYRLLSNDIKFEELIHENMLKLKNFILENVFNSRPSLFDGLTEVAFSILAVNKVTGDYGKFLNKTNQLLRKWTNDFVQTIDAEESLSTDCYDAIYGISGILKYLLYFAEEEVELITKLLSLLVYLSGCKDTEAGLLPLWHIKKQNLRPEKDKINYPSGYINLGLAHGIAGPLVVMSEAYKKGIIVEGHLEAIHSIVGEYKKFAYHLNGSTYWPNLLSPEQYLIAGETFHRSKFRESWCYGAIGIAKVLFTTGNCIGDRELSNWAYGILEQKAQLELQDLLLDSPSLCHGYAGVLSILSSTYRSRPSSALLSGIDKTERKIMELYDESSLYGFWDIEIFANHEMVKKDRNTFLDGSAGVILSLLSANGYGDNFFMNKLMI